MKIEVMGRIRYPDAVVSCTQSRRDVTVISQPVVIFEILSLGTSQTDRIDKLREYQATSSVQRYVILESDSIAATVFARGVENWIARPLLAGDVLEMPEIGVTISLSDIYADVELAPLESGGTVSASAG